MLTGILAGRVSQRGDSLSISVELIDGRDRTQVWGEQYVRKAADSFQVSADISRDVAAKLQVVRPRASHKVLGTRESAEPGGVRTAAQRTFPSREGSGRRTGRKPANTSFGLSPPIRVTRSPMPIYPTSIAVSSVAGWLDPNEYLPKARAAAQKALELDEGLADGHYALANLMTYAWEWADAEREYKRAIELNPNLALAHRWYATYLRLMGRHEQAITEITRARELDPLSPGVNATVGYVLSSARRYDQAMLALNKDDRAGSEAYPYTTSSSATPMPLRASMRRPLLLYTRASRSVSIRLPRRSIWVRRPRMREIARVRWRSSSSLQSSKERTFSQRSWRFC